MRCAKGARRVQIGCAKGAETRCVSMKIFLTAKPLGVVFFLLYSCCDPRCRYVHMLAWVRDGHALSFFRGVDAPVSYARTEGN